jgi:para-nitrobenzyl esterase
MKQIHLMILLVFAAGCGGGSGSAPVDPPIVILPPPLAVDEVQTAEGVYKGSVEGNLLVFRGVRYAAPPVGNLRFKAPAAPAAFAGTSDATQFSENCFQTAGAAGSVGAEDCLFLNIWSHDDDVERPVLVFLHGGGSNGIGGDLATSDGAMLAENADIIAVTLNRRLGILGNLALDELISENPRNTAGNYMVLDVIAALSWLQDNIAEFDGDPNRVMLVGESSGAGVVCHVIAAPEAAGLISAAVIQSGACSRRGRLNDSVPVAMAPIFDTAVNTNGPVVAAAGCDMAADIPQCLRDMTADEVLDAGRTVVAANNGRGVFGPVIDGVVVVSDPHTALMAETVGNIPIIVGSTANEGGNGFSGPPPVDDAQYRARLTAIFDAPRDDQIYAVYPTADFPSVGDAWETFWGDWWFNCGAEELARSASGNTPAYLYMFSRGFSTGSRAGLGALHATDVPFLFETYDVFGHTPDADDALVTDAMQNAWAGLASDPTAAPPYLPTGASSWPAYDSNNVQVVNFDATVTVDSIYREGRCTLLRDIISL